MSDETKAGIISGAYLGFLFLGCAIFEDNKTAAFILILAATLALIGILYASWLLDRKNKRLNRYIDHVDAEIRKASERGDISE